jgi:hypothetical protein
VRYLLHVQRLLGIQRIELILKATPLLRQRVRHGGRRPKVLQLATAQEGTRCVAAAE